VRKKMWLMIREWVKLQKSPQIRHDKCLDQILYAVKPTPITNRVGSPAAQNFTFTHLYASAVVATVAKFVRVTYHDKAKN